MEPSPFAMRKMQLSGVLRIRGASRAFDAGHVRVEIVRICPETQLIPRGHHVWSCDATAAIGICQDLLDG